MNAEPLSAQTGWFILDEIKPIRTASKPIELRTPTTFDIQHQPIQFYYKRKCASNDNEALISITSGHKWASFRFTAPHNGEVNIIVQGPESVSPPNYLKPFETSKQQNFTLNAYQGVLANCIDVENITSKNSGTTSYKFKMNVEAGKKYFLIFVGDGPVHILNNGAEEEQKHWQHLQNTENVTILYPL